MGTKRHAAQRDFSLLRIHWDWQMVVPLVCRRFLFLLLLGPCRFSELAFVAKSSLSVDALCALSLAALRLDSVRIGQAISALDDG